MQTFVCIMLSLLVSACQGGSHYYKIYALMAIPDSGYHHIAVRKKKDGKTDSYLYDHPVLFM